MYTYEEFKQTMTKLLQEKAGDNAEVNFTEIIQNNGKKQEGVMVWTPDRNIEPIILLPELYTGYRAGESLSGCMDKVIRKATCEEYGFNPVVPRDWAEIKGKIKPYLLNYQWNEEKLADMPYRKFLDLAVVLRCHLQETETRRVSLDVTKRMLDYWGITEDELWSAAENNLRKEKFQIWDVNEILRGFSMETEQTKKLRGKQYVMSNLDRYLGAAGLIRTDLLMEFAKEKGCGFYILPSSLHELIFMPDRGIYQAEALKEMVCSVNQEMVLQEEWLSDKVYYFSPETEKVKCLY